MLLYTFTVSHVALHPLHCQPLLFGSSTTTQFPSTAARSHVSLLLTGFPPLYDSTNINIGDEKRS